MSAEIGRQILEAIKTYVANQIASVTSRVDQVAASLAGVDAAIKSLPPPAKGDKGDAGSNGHTPTTDELRAIITPLIPDAIPGPRGDPGDPGVDGASPSIEQIRDLIQGILPAAIPGDRGEQGDRGEAGADGHTPTPDELRAIITPLIPAPIPGEHGERGIDGKDGQNGVAGRDAVQLEILPSIDDAKCYPRGTYARHGGGLWRSFESTFGLRGWECIVEGIAEEAETLSDDGRTLVRTTRYSSGRTFERSFRMAVILDKGVYKADTDYSPGDAVTWAGSVWIAQHRDGASPYGKPSTPGSGWRLAVKAGRDARL